MRKYSVSDLRKILKLEKIIGNKDLKFSNAKLLEQADKESIVWIKSNNKHKEQIVESTKASFIVIDSAFKIPKKFTKIKCFIVTSNPKLTFIRIIKTLFYIKYPNEIHLKAIIHPNAIIDKNCYIGPNTYIGESIIKAGTVIHGNCYIYDNVKIGKNVTINACSVVGSLGYGYSRNEDGELEHFPHIGGVIIEDNVDIGSNTCIDRGALGNTIVKEGAKIDNLVHIAHNVVIGRHTAIIANSMLGGSVKIGDFSWVAPSASILNQIDIGEKVTIGMGAVVTKNVPNGQTWAGIPARPLKEFVEIQKYLKQNIKSSS